MCPSLRVHSVCLTLVMAGSGCFGLSHLAPSSSLTSASAEPPWEDVASKTQLLPLNSTALGSILLDTASGVSLGQKLFFTFSIALVPSLGVSSSLQCPAQTGSASRASRTRTEVSQGSAGCPHGPLWRRAQALPGRRGVYPRSRQQGAPFRLGSRGGGGAALRFAALSCAALCSSPDRAGAAGCRVSASAACRAGSGGW